jgi:hypothetical protein
MKLEGDGIILIIDEKQSAGAKMSDITGRNPTYIVLDCDDVIIPGKCKSSSKPLRV